MIKLKIAGKINGRPVIYEHHLQFYCEHGYCPDRVGTAKDGTLYDMSLSAPITDQLRRDVLDVFHKHGKFVPIGDDVVDKVTGGIRLRRKVIERMVKDGDLCYQEGCYRLTSPAT